MPTISTVFWDFDGVLLRSNQVRDQGFAQVLASYPEDQVEQLMTYHRRNGGLSRYVKFRYFYEEVLGESLSEAKLLQLCDAFSGIMRDLLPNRELLITENIDRLRAAADRLDMYIVSGSDQTELRYLCGELGIADYFLGIYGSPIRKIDLVANVLATKKYAKESCVLIGDSINDLEAARHNGISFIGYDDASLEEQSDLTFAEVFNVGVQ